jgi:hypothetical protein
MSPGVDPVDRSRNRMRGGRRARRHLRWVSDADADPSTGKWIDTGADNEPWSRRSEEGFAVASIAVALILSGFLLAFFGGSAAPTGSISLVVAPVLFLGWRYRQRLLQTPTATQADEGMMEDWARAQISCLVEMTIYQCGVETGKDRGVTWLQDGAVCFSGHRCSFVVGGQDLVGYREPLKERTIAFNARAGRSEYRVRFEALVSTDGREAVRPFFELLGKFHERRPKTIRPRQAPPLSLDPRLPRVNYWWPMALAVAAGPTFWFMLGPELRARVPFGVTADDFDHSLLAAVVVWFMLRPLNNSFRTRNVRRTLSELHADAVDSMAGPGPRVSLEGPYPGHRPGDRTAAGVGVGDPAASPKSLRKGE